jgi:hypothetical protein
MPFNPPPLREVQQAMGHPLPDTMPTIRQATLWIAELGGYTGKSSGGPPGAITIGRGFEFVAGAAAMLEALGIRRVPKSTRKPAGKAP